MPHVPYNTGRVRIGDAFHKPPRVHYTRDDELLQSAFIGRGRRIHTRLSSDFVMWLIAICLFSLSAFIFLK